MAYPQDAYPEEEYALKEARKSRLPLVEQDKALAELQEVINLLADRLNPIMTPTEPTEKMGEDRAVPVQSEVANTLSDNNARIYRMTRRVTNMLDRVEV